VSENNAETAETNAAASAAAALVSENNAETAETNAAASAAAAAASLSRVVVLKVLGDATSLTTGDGKMYFTVPVELNGKNIVSVGAHVYTVSSSGLPTIQIHNLTDTVDILSTLITIDVNEKDSSTAAAAVIDAAHDDVATADELRIDVDVAGTGTKGLEVRMGFQ
jgi:hypothetical protein